MWCKPKQICDRDLKLTCQELNFLRLMCECCCLLPLILFRQKKREFILANIHLIRCCCWCECIFWLYVMLAASISAVPHTCCCSVRWFEILITAFWPPHVNQTQGFLAYEVLSGFPSGLRAPLCDSVLLHSHAPPPPPPTVRGWIKACTGILVGVQWLVLPSQSCISCTPISPQWGSSMSLATPIPVQLFYACTSHRIHPLEP